MKMLRINKVLIFLLTSCSFFYPLEAQTNLLSPQEIDSILQVNSGFLAVDEQLVYLDMRFPCYISLEKSEKEFIGRLNYDSGLASSFLQGKGNVQGVSMLQEIDREENLIGFIELNGFIPQALESMRWYNADRTRSYGFSLASDSSDSPRQMTGPTRYFSRRNEKCATVHLKELPIGYKLQLTLDDDSYHESSLMPVSSEKSNIYQGAIEKLGLIKYRPDLQQISFENGQKCNLKKKKVVADRHVQRQINFSELLWVDVPKIDDEVFNLKMKHLINLYVFKDHCKPHVKDEKQHWWHYRKAEADIMHIDKRWTSMRMRLLNTCGESVTDTVLYINYNRKKSKFVHLEEVQRSIKWEGGQMPICSNCVGLPVGYTYSKSGLTLHYPFDMILGECSCNLSWEELGFKNRRKFMRALE